MLNVYSPPRRVGTGYDHVENSALLLGMSGLSTVAEGVDGAGGGQRRAPVGVELKVLVKNFEALMVAVRSPDTGPVSVICAETASAEGSDIARLIQCYRADIVG